MIKTEKFKSIPLTSTFYNEERKESQTWAYAPSASSIKISNGVAEVQNVKPLVIGLELALHKINDCELIFYLLNVSKSFRGGKIYHKNPRAENQKQANDAALSAEAMMLVYGADSPLNGNGDNLEALKRIAVSWGVNINDTYPEEIKNNLWAFVQTHQKSQSKRKKLGFEALIKAVGDIKNSSKRAVVLNSINKKFLRFNEEHLQWELHILGSSPTPLCDVHVNDHGKENDIIVDFIMKNEDYLSVLQGALDNAGDSSVLTKYGPDTERGDLIKTAMDLGWAQAATLKNEQLIEICNYQQKFVG